MKTIINSNLYISLAAVFFCIETQIQLGLKPQWHPYLFLIFFATLFEYNLHRLITIVTNKEALQTEKHRWVRENKGAFYFLVLASIVGFAAAAMLAKKEVLFALSPIAFITFFYSIPFFGKNGNLLRLREIPYLKIFLIAFVWASSTLLLPLIHSGLEFSTVDTMLIFIERFFFVFSITIPFDIRDIQSDKQASLKTIPLLFSEKKSYAISYFSLSLFLVVSIFHYTILFKSYSLAIAFGLSFIATFICLYSKKIREMNYYHYGILDGTIIFQAVLVVFFYYLKFL